jgi:hypothetical protein
MPLGTSKALYIYYEDAFYDITPLGTAITVQLLLQVTLPTLLL